MGLLIGEIGLPTGQQRARSPYTHRDDYITWPKSRRFISGAGYLAPTLFGGA